MATAFVQAATGDNNPGATTVTAVFAGVTAGNCLVLAAYSIADVSVSSVTDGTNTWTIDDSQHDATTGRWLATAHAKNIAGGALTVTANLSASGRVLLDVHEVSGCDTASQPDGHVTNFQAFPTTAADAVTTTQITTTVNGAYIFAAAFDLPATGTLTHGFGFVAGSYDVNLIASERQVQSIAGAIAGTFTENTNQAVLSAIVALKASTAGAGDAMMAATIGM